MSMRTSRPRLRTRLRQRFGPMRSWAVHVGTAACALGLAFVAGLAGASLGSWLPPLLPAHSGAFWFCLTSMALGFALLLVAQVRARAHTVALHRGQAVQQELEHSVQALERSLQARRHLLARVGHGLRTPMHAVLGFNALLLSQVRDRPEAMRLLHLTGQSADHLMAVIDDLLEASPQPGRRLGARAEPLDLHALLSHAFALWAPMARGQQLDYRLELDPDLPQGVCGDQQRILQVLLNLLGNAFKFTPQGSVVLRAQWLKPGVLFSVQDTGIGMAPSQRARLFQRFVQAHDEAGASHGGHGLGLALSQALVALQGGEIGCDSAPGQGSRFWFRLPLQACPAPPSGPSLYPDHRPLPRLATAPRLMVVDDDPASRGLFKRVMRQAWPQAEILEAADGQQCLDLLAQGPVDLVLMDMLMPVMDGIEATRRIRADASWSSLPVLGLTANLNPQDLQAFREAGLNDLLLKPLEPGALVRAVESARLSRD